MTWTLYHAPLACSLACRFALAELGTPHELIVLNLADGGSHTPEYLLLNRRGRVPALVTEAGVLTENVAILSYVADTAPQAGLIPAEPWARAQAVSWLAWLSNTVHPAYARAIRPERFSEAPEGAAGVRNSAAAVLSDALSRADAQLADRDHLLDRLSICDLYLLVFALWRRSPVLAGRLPELVHLDAWQARLLARPGLAACAADDMRLYAAQAQERAA